MASVIPYSGFSSCRFAGISQSHRSSFLLVLYVLVLLSSLSQTLFFFFCVFVLEISLTSMTSVTLYTYCDDSKSLYLYNQQLLNTYFQISQKHLKLSMFKSKLVKLGGFQQLVLKSILAQARNLDIVYDIFPPPHYLTYIQSFTRTC